VSIENRVGLLQHKNKARSSLSLSFIFMLTNLICRIALTALCRMSRDDNALSNSTTEK